MTVRQVVYGRVLEVRGLKPSPSLGKTNVVVKVGMELVCGGKRLSLEVSKTAARPKNHAMRGVDFTVAMGDQRAESTFLRSEAKLTAEQVAKSSVLIKVYEQQKTDLVDHAVGTGKVELRTIRAQSMGEAEKIQVTAGGVGVSMQLWMRESTTTASAFAWRPVLGATLVGAFVAGRFALGAPNLTWAALTPPALAWLVLELPGLLAVALTKILALAVPGLGLSMSSLRLGLSLAKGDLLVDVAVDDFALAHDESYEFGHKNFVACDRVSVGVAIDVASAAKTIWRLLRRPLSAPEPPATLRLKASGESLAAKDKWLARESTSDPYFRLVVAPSAEVEAAALGEKNHDFDPDACVELCRSEYLEKELSPEWDELELDLAVVEEKTAGFSKSVLVVVLDYDYGSASDLIGVGKLDKFQDSRVELKKRGKSAGFFDVRVSTATSPCSARPPLVAWRPFPTQHDAIRRKLGIFFEPPRLATVGLEVRVDGPTIAFDVAEKNDEFNVNNFCRLVAEGKVRSTTGLREMPNSLAVALNDVRFKDSHKDGKLAKAVVEVRGDKRTIGPVQITDGICSFGGKTETFDVADPSAVVVVSVSIAGREVGKWITTLKMIPVAPTNVFGKDVVGEKLPDGYRMAGDMELRKHSFAKSSRASIGLALDWTARPDGLGHDQILAKKRLKALEQLQENSAETTLKLGNLQLLAHLLADFPVLFDVRAFELNRINFHLKALFQGYDTDTAADDAKAIYLKSIDLHDKLAVPPGADGRDLLDLTITFVKAMVGPVLKEVSITQAASEILSGVAVGLFSDDKAAD